MLPRHSSPRPPPAASARRRCGDSVQHVARDWAASAPPSPARIARRVEQLAQSPWNTSYSPSSWALPSMVASFFQNDDGDEVLRASQLQLRDAVRRRCARARHRARLHARPRVRALGQREVEPQQRGIESLVPVAADVDRRASSPRRAGDTGARRRHRRESKAAGSSAGAALVRCGRCLVRVLQQRRLRLCAGTTMRRSLLLGLARSTGSRRGLARNRLEILAREREHFLGVETSPASTSVWLFGA